MKPDIVPNYYAYSLKVNGKDLSNSQKEHFFNCINKIYKNNYKVIYRGDKRDKLQLIYGVGDNNLREEFSHSLFIIGAKAQMYLGSGLPGINDIDIAETGNNEFRLIFRMLSNLLSREFQFGTIRTALGHFRKTEERVTRFFQARSNEQVFTDIIDRINTNKKIIIRDYYLALLHHVSKSEYYASSFLLSTTSNFSQAHKFAWGKENEGSSNPLILFGWLPNGYEGILAAPNSQILRKKVDMDVLGLPVYEKSFFPFQKEITLKGGLLPHHLLGYLCYYQGQEIFEINSALFHTDNSWDGVELPVDQSTFHQRMQNTLFGRFFTVDEDNGQYQQHQKL